MKYNIFGFVMSLGIAYLVCILCFRNSDDNYELDLNSDDKDIVYACGGSADGIPKYKRSLRVFHYIQF